MAAQTWVVPVTLEDSRVRLEPLAEAHLPDLTEQAADPEIWRWITGLPMDPTSLRRWLDAALASAANGTEVPLATIDAVTGRAIGSTRFMSIAPEHRRLEIGGTWLGIDHQRSGANRAVKLLQLKHAFDVLGAIRVEFKTHARNERSRAALLGIGATFEGVHRHHMILADGSLRDSAYYGVLADDWPTVRLRLEERIRQSLVHARFPGSARHRIPAPMTSTAGRGVCHHLADTLG